MALIDQIRPEIVKVPLTSTTKESTIRELIEILHGAGEISNVDAVYDAVMERESKGSTGLEIGVAVPHAKTSDVAHLIIALGISPKGIEFEALDGKPSHLFFLILAPPDQSGPHIEALAEIARLTRSQSFCNMLIETHSAEEVVRLFEE